MQYVMLGTIRSHLTKDERLAAFGRRAEWKYPVGVKVVGEWWRASAPQIVTVIECEQYDPILAINAEWSDFMELQFSPCTTPDAGLRAAQKAVAK
jgi:hypothetical protein